MSEQELEKLKDSLLQEKELLEKELSSFAKKDPLVKGDWDSRYPRIPGGDIEDASNEVEEYATRLALEYKLETRLQEVNKTLEQIEKGTYDPSRPPEEQE